MKTKIRFKALDITTFRMDHSDAAEALDEDDIPQTLPAQYGLVKIPGHGWLPCTLGKNGHPSFFFSEDDGWQECPDVTFEKE